MRADTVMLCRSCEEEICNALPTEPERTRVDTMCDSHVDRKSGSSRTVPVDHAVGIVLAHDIAEIRPGAFKGRAFKKGHVVRQEVSTTCSGRAR